MRTALVFRLRVTISPWNSWPDFLKEPMLAMSLLLAGFELCDHRGLDGDLRAEGDRRRTRAGRSAAEDGGGETSSARAYDRAGWRALARSCTMGPRTLQLPRPCQSAGGPIPRQDAGDAHACPHRRRVEVLQQPCRA